MKTINLVSLLVLTILLWRCQPDLEIQPKEFPFVITNDATEINSTGVTFNAEILDFGKEEIMEYGFLWGNNDINTENYEYFKILGTKLIDKTFSYNLKSGLKKDTHYYVRSYLKTSQRAIYGNIIKFNSEGSLPPEIKKFTPDYGKAGTKVEIEGNYFALSKTENIVKFGDVIAIIDSVSETKLFVTIPEFTKPEKVKISVETADMKAESLNTFDLWFPWRRIHDFPGEFRNNPVHFVVDNKAYIGLGVNHHDLWEYDSEADVFERKTDFSGEFINDVVTGFAINKKGYILIVRHKYNYSITEVWEYDPELDRWSQKADFPVYNKIYFVPLIIGDKAFLIADSYENAMTSSKSFWEYNYKSDKWVQKSNFPGNSLVYGIMGFSFNGNGYAGADYVTSDQKVFYKYDPANNSWSYFSAFPGVLFSETIAFALDNNFYAGASEYSSNAYFDFWKYDTGNMTWSALKPCPSKFSPQIGFTIGNKGYLGIGITGYYSETNILYEFDPSKN